MLGFALVQRTESISAIVTFPGVLLADFVQIDSVWCMSRPPLAEEH